MQVAESKSPAATATLDFRAKPYGFNGGSRFDLYQAVASYRLGDEVKDITTPLLITDPDDEQFSPGSPNSCTTSSPVSRNSSGSPHTKAPTATASRCPVTA